MLLKRLRDRIEEAAATGVPTNRVIEGLAQLEKKHRTELKRQLAEVIGPGRKTTLTNVLSAMDKEWSNSRIQDLERYLNQHSAEGVSAAKVPWPLCILFGCDRRKASAPDQN